MMHGRKNIKLPLKQLNSLTHTDTSIITESIVTSSMHMHTRKTYQFMGMDHVRSLCVI